MNYTSIKNFGPNAVSEVNNPLTYCLTTSLDSSFAHGAIANSFTSNTSRNCQVYMAEYCAKNDNEWENDYYNPHKNAFIYSLDSLII